MTYADAKYISVARNSEVKHHVRTMDQLHAKITQLTKAVTWELEQHHSRLKELQQAEDTLAMADSPQPSISKQPTLEPTPSSHRRWTQSRKYVHRSSQKPVAELVG
jgi:hypothetical protein